MAKFNKNNRKSDISAMMSDSVIRTIWHGREVFSKKPPPPKRKRNSPMQQESIDRFRGAHAYADRVLQSEEKSALYAKGINPKRTSAHTVAFQDYLNPPVIHYISVYKFKGRAGDVITVKATDDFRVEAVAIEVFDGKGNLLEKGNAERYKRKPFIWKYKTTVANENFDGSVIVATATDLAGNDTAMSGKLQIKSAD